MNDRPFEEELDALKADIADLRTDMSSLLSSLRGSAEESGEGIKATMQEQMRRTREQVRQRLDEARVRSRKTMDEMEETISEHPIGSIATAVGVGFIIAKLMDVGRR